MIDIENMVLDAVSKAVHDHFPTASICGEYVEVPAAFPCVTIVEDANTTYRKTLDDSIREHHVELNYTVNVYSDLHPGKKTQCKEICDVVDDVIMSLKFTRTMRSHTPNIDRTLYRITMRYTVVVAEPFEDEDGNKVYQMYRE